MKQNSRAKPPFLASLFTPQERAAVAFLLAVGFLGLGIRAFQTGASGFDQQAVRWPEGRGGASSSAGRWQIVSLNRAGVAELTALPGIGPVTARRIAEHREKHGRFLTLTDLKRVKGISSKTLERISGYVRFD